MPDELWLYCCYVLYVVRSSMSCYPVVNIPAFFGDQVFREACGVQGMFFFVWGGGV